MSDFRFANPDWSFALWGVLAVVGLLLWLEQRRGHALSQFVSTVMQPNLVSRFTMLRRMSVIVLLGLSGVCFVVALMRPQFGLTYVKSPRVGAQVMFCLDVSKSMLAEDVAPNRLERAKADITDLLGLLDGDQVGLIGFAGRATVLCPLTPDYGFFKLILSGAGPSSVGRGGTRLEEPLRKALDGFRSESDVSRVVFLITDGEDHDSHPLDVADDAIERGIKIVAVGLGDEAGSEIRITDPRTGIQSQVLDADGKPVITRLDGETLRGLALATEGVFIPAGTGSLDLKSIYDAHIKPLVRGQMDSEGRAIRRDAFQWAVLVGLVFLMASVVLASGQSEPTGELQQLSSQTTRTQAMRSKTTNLNAALLLCLLSLGIDGTSLAEESATVESTPDQQTPVSRSINDTESKVDAREVYNQAVGRLERDFDRAETLLTQARREAAGDGEVRYRSTYNMGWVEVNRANELIENEPEKSLEHLQRAAGWFRDAVRLRGDSVDARHNLDVVLLRIMQLRDQLAKRDEKNLAGHLDDLIQTQRSVIAKLRGLVEEVAQRDDPNIAEDFRSQFQGFAIDQRLAISDLQEVVDLAGGEKESLDQKAESDRTPEENVRFVQLTSVMDDLNQASQRIGQSRSQLRRRQASRGFRRAAMGLNQLKHARDRLRDPLQILDAILTDLTSTAQHTAIKSIENQFADPSVDVTPIPAWIDQDYLSDSQSDLTQRVDELTRQLAAGLENASGDQSASSEDETSRAPELDQQQSEFLAKIERAMPYLIAANDSMNAADQKLSLAEYAAAGEQQISAIKSLQLAREQFADLRALIELAYASQQEIAGVLETDRAGPGSSDDNKQIAQLVAERVVELQSENLDRMERLQRAIDAAMAEAKSTSDDLPEQGDKVIGDDGNEEPSDEVQRLTFATQLAARGVEQMKAVVDETTNRFASDPERSSENPGEPATEQTSDSEGDVSEPGEDASDPFKQAKVEANAAVETLQDLRRLFFSVIEHLQETAQRQANLNDDTEQSAGSDADSNPDVNLSRENAEQLADRQTELSSMANRIAEALQQQADAGEQDSAENAQPDQANGNETEQDAMMKQNAEKAKQAADLVTAAEDQMKIAHQELVAEDAQVAAARPSQDLALEKLAEALRILQPPQDDQSDQQQSQDQQQQSTGEDEQQQQQQQQQGQMDPSRVLQAVRDREAQRRREKDQRQSAGQIPVERDW